MHRTSVILFLAASVLPVGILAQGKSPGIEIDQELVRYAVVREPALVRFLVEDFMITEQEVERLTIYDLVGDGFGEGDFARVHPGGKIYAIAPGKKAQALMNNWKFGDNIKFTANADDPPEFFENAPDSVRALGGIFASLLRGLRRNYNGVPMKISLEQNRGVAAIEMWGYDKRLLQYAPPPVENREKLQPIYHLIYLEKAIVDTVHYGPRQSSR